MANYWVIENDNNMLQGIPGDLKNPAKLPDSMIVYAIQQSQRARDDLNKLFPSLLPKEQERLRVLFRDNKFVSNLKEDVVVTSDKFQAGSIAKIKVFTAGPHGGIGYDLPGPAKNTRIG